MTYRSNKNEKIYINYRKNNPSNGCDFCQFSQAGSERIVKEAKHFWIVKNVFGYDTWDNLNVKSHLMIVPKNHIESLAQLPKAWLKEYIELVADYETKGFSIYLRAMNNASKTVPHMHTHLIQLGNKSNKIYLFLRKPYFLWYKS